MTLNLLSWKRTSGDFLKFLLIALSIHKSKIEPSPNAVSVSKQRRYFFHSQIKKAPCTDANFLIVLYQCWLTFLIWVAQFVANIFYVVATMVFNAKDRCFQSFLTLLQRVSYWTFCHCSIFPLLMTIFKQPSLKGIKEHVEIFY